MTDYELVIVAHKGQCPIRGKRDGSVWSEGKVFNMDMVHPTEKPLNLIERLIAKFSDTDALVFDCFAGSFTTCVAAKKLHRRWIGIEISEDYCEIGRQRLAQGVLDI